MMLLTSFLTSPSLAKKYHFLVHGDFDDGCKMDLEFPNVTRAVLFHNSFCGILDMEFRDSVIDFHESTVVTVTPK